MRNYPKMGTLSPGKRGLSQVRSNAPAFTWQVVMCVGSDSSCLPGHVEMPACSGSPQRWVQALTSFIFLSLCWCSPSTGWKIISRPRAFQKGVSLLRTKSRDRVGPAHTVGQPPDRPGKADHFHGLIANVYSFRTKQILARSLVLSDWWGRYRVFTGVGIFT